MPPLCQWSTHSAGAGCHKCAWKHIATVQKLMAPVGCLCCPAFTRSRWRMHWSKGRVGKDGMGQDKCCDADGVGTWSLGAGWEQWQWCTLCPVSFLGQICWHKTVWTCAGYLEGQMWFAPLQHLDAASIVTSPQNAAEPALAPLHQHWGAWIGLGSHKSIVLWIYCLQTFMEQKPSDAWTVICVWQMHLNVEKKTHIHVYINICMAQSYTWNMPAYVHIHQCNSGHNYWP